MNKFHTIILATYLLNLCTPAYSRSEIIGYDVFNLTLEELLNVEVITASKTLEGQWSAPSVMTVISAEEIQLFGSRSLAEVLQKVVGIQPYFSSTYGLNFLSVRGDTQSNVDARTLVLVDGRPMFRSSITHGSNVTPYTLFPVETLQRIEVIRGPGSVLYGSGAFSSVINLITEDSKDSKESNASVKIG
ncbi:MAG: TonB-dependent receptor plug domain-containing protein, partial [Flavobacteriales bacterium]|nr:TonB-dependent receptor plug domain-containing protein [Flavobacteriales bacterium]